MSSLTPLFTSHPVSSPSVNVVGSAPNMCFNLIIYCNLLCSDAGSSHPHLCPSLVFTTVVLEQSPNCSVFLCLQSWVPSVHPVHGLQGPFKSVLSVASHTRASNPPVAFSYNKIQTPTPYRGLQGGPWYPAAAASFFPQVCQPDSHFLASAVTSAFCLGCFPSDLCVAASCFSFRSPLSFHSLAMDSVPV